jgi:hypothetical protein
MTTTVRRIRLFICAALLVGCISPQNTRLPTLRPSSVAAERQSYVYHNPLPDNEVGQAIDLPRGFDRQRSEPTRVQERSAITDSIVGGSGGGASNNPSASKYPGSVNE